MLIPCVAVSGLFSIFGSQLFAVSKSVFLFQFLSVVVVKTFRASNGSSLLYVNSGDETRSNAIDSLLS